MAHAFPRLSRLAAAVAASVALHPPLILASDKADGRDDTAPASDSAPESPGATDRAEIARVASRSPARGAIAPPPPATAADREAIAQARRAVADGRERYKLVHDYTCTFLKRERVGGRLVAQNVMHMKARTSPNSIYFRFQKPNKGREAIYVAGRNHGRLVAHDVGLGKIVAGTLVLDPLGETAMEDCRHPITEAGIGALLETLNVRWAAELTPGETLVSHNPQMKIGAHACSMIETVHPGKSPRYLYHKVRLYIDNEHGLPIRFEAYDWPARPGDAPELVEEYTYLDLRTNVGLTDHDFDPRNHAYSFGRF